MYIDRIAVHENYRGQNIGKEIYQHVEKFAIVNNIEFLTAEINLLPKKMKYHLNSMKNMVLGNLALKNTQMITKYLFKRRI